MEVPGVGNISKSVRLTIDTQHILQNHHLLHQPEAYTQVYTWELLSFDKVSGKIRFVLVDG